MASGPTYAQLANNIRDPLRILYDDTIIFRSKFHSTTSKHAQLLDRLEKCLDNLVWMVNDLDQSPIMVMGAISESLITLDIDYIQKTLGKMESIQLSDLQAYLGRIGDVCETFRYIIERQKNF